MRRLHPLLLLVVLVLPPQVVGDTERQRESRQRGEDERVFAKKVGLTDQESRPHADVPANALVRFQSLDAAHPVGGVAEFVVAVRREVVGRLDRQIPFAGDPDEVRMEAIVPEVGWLRLAVARVGLNDLAGRLVFE